MPSARCGHGAGSDERATGRVYPNRSHEGSVPAAQKTLADECRHFVGKSCTARPDLQKMQTYPTARRAQTAPAETSARRTTVPITRLPPRNEALQEGATVPRTGTGAGRSAPWSPRERRSAEFSPHRLTARLRETPGRVTPHTFGASPRPRREILVFSGNWPANPICAIVRFDKDCCYNAAELWQLPRLNRSPSPRRIVRCSSGFWPVSQSPCLR